MYIRTLNDAKNDAIANSFLRKDADLNANLLRMPPGEQVKGYLEDDPTLLPA